MFIIFIIFFIVELEYFKIKRGIVISQEIHATFKKVNLLIIFYRHCYLKIINTFFATENRYKLTFYFYLGLRLDFITLIIFFLFIFIVNN